MKRTYIDYELQIQRLNKIFEQQQQKQGSQTPDYSGGVNFGGYNRQYDPQLQSGPNVFTRLYRGLKSGIYRKQSYKQDYKQAPQYFQSLLNQFSRYYNTFKNNPTISTFQYIKEIHDFFVNNWKKYHQDYGKTVDQDHPELLSVYKKITNEMQEAYNIADEANLDIGRRRFRREQEKPEETPEQNEKKSWENFKSEAISNFKKLQRARYSGDLQSVANLANEIRALYSAQKREFGNIPKFIGKTNMHALLKHANKLKNKVPISQTMNNEYAGKLMGLYRKLKTAQSQQNIKSAKEHADSILNTVNFYETEHGETIPNTIGKINVKRIIDAAEKFSNKKIPGSDFIDLKKDSDVEFIEDDPKQPEQSLSAPEEKKKTPAQLLKMMNNLYSKKNEESDEVVKIIAKSLLGTHNSRVVNNDLVVKIDGEEFKFPIGEKISESFVRFLKKSGILSEGLGDFDLDFDLEDVSLFDNDDDDGVVKKPRTKKKSGKKTSGSLKSVETEKTNDKKISDLDLEKINFDSEESEIGQSTDKELSDLDLDDVNIDQVDPDIEATDTKGIGSDKSETDSIEEPEDDGFSSLDDLDFDLEDASLFDDDEAEKKQEKEKKSKDKPVSDKKEISGDTDTVSLKDIVGEPKEPLDLEDFGIDDVDFSDDENKESKPVAPKIEKEKVKADRPVSSKSKKVEAKPKKNKPVTKKSGASKKGIKKPITSKEKGQEIDQKIYDNARTQYHKIYNAYSKASQDDLIEFYKFIAQNLFFGSGGNVKITLPSGEVMQPPIKVDVKK